MFFLAANWYEVDSEGLWILGVVSVVAAFLFTVVYLLWLVINYRRTIQHQAVVNIELLKTREALKEAKNRMTAILEAAHAGFVVIEAETRQILDLNPAACELFGWAKAELLGQVCHSCFCPTCAGDCPVLDHGQTIRNVRKVIHNRNGQDIPVTKTVVKTNIGGKPCLLESFMPLPAGS